MKTIPHSHQPLSAAAERLLAGTDAAVIQASLTQPDVFAVLFDKYAVTLHRYAARRVGDDAADDLVGATFLAAFRARDRYDAARPDARPWLFGILTREISRQRRTESARWRALARTAPDRPADGLAEQVASSVSAQAQHRVLAAALARLSAADRTVLLLIAWGELSYDEAAQALGIPIGTVRSRLSRARAQVRAALGGVNPTTLNEETACTN
jgi:RNA polymerase sigma-70 factor (ECF subfamily)